jgi:DNA repair protein RecO (recombination protein O)
MAHDPALTQAPFQDAVVLGSVAFGDSDRVIRLLVAERGKVDAVARGARGSRKRFGGALDPGTRLRVALRSGRGALPWLEAVEVRRAPSKARTTLGRLSLLTWGCEVIGSLIERDLEADRLRTLLEIWLDLLEGEVEPHSGSRVAFEAKALTFAGLAPALVRCAVCSRILEDPCVFSMDVGGMHRGCGQGLPVLAGDLSCIERLRRTPLVDTTHEGVPNEARWLLVSFLEHQAGRPLKSRDALPWEDG